MKEKGVEVEGSSGIPAELLQKSCSICLNVHQVLESPPRCHI